MDIAIVTQLAQLGATGILLVILFFLWQEFKKQNEFIRDLLTKSEAERVVVAERMGMTPSEFNARVEAVRREQRTNRN